MNDTPSIERSTGLPVTVGVMHFRVGSGYSGATQELDNAVAAGAEALRDLFSHPVVIRFNSDRQSGGAFLRTSEPDSFAGNAEIGIGADLFKLSRMRDVFPDAPPEAFTDNCARLTLDPGGPNEQIRYTTNIKAPYLRDPAMANREGCSAVKSGPLSQAYSYRYHRTLADAVAFVREHAVTNPRAVTEAIGKARAEAMAAKIAVTEAAIATLDKTKLANVVRRLEGRFWPPRCFTLERASKPVLRACIVRAVREGGYTFKPEHVLHDDDVRGLQAWVKDYKAVRAAGNVTLARQIRDNIDGRLTELGVTLESETRLSIYGPDPDDPANK